MLPHRSSRRQFFCTRRSCLGLRVAEPGKTECRTQHADKPGAPGARRASEGRRAVEMNLALRPSLIETSVLARQYLSKSGFCVEKMSHGLPSTSVVSLTFCSASFVVSSPPCLAIRRVQIAFYRYAKFVEPDAAAGRRCGAPRRPAPLGAWISIALITLWGRRTRHRLSARAHPGNSHCV